MTSERAHATCIAIEGKAVLLRGGSGAGKSDLAYRLVMDQGAKLVADDRVVIKAENDKLTVTVEEGWAGQLELRGLGIVTLPHVPSAELVLIVDLVGRGEVPRLPDPAFETVLGVTVPLLKLHAFDGTTPAKTVTAIKHLPQSGFPGDDGRLA